jgi:protein-tyrosine kinase
MAKFRDSSLHDAGHATTATADAETATVHDRSIGAIISETRNLSAEQVEQILAHQRDKGVRFGEAAIALGFASTDDVLFALAQQFHYPYAPEERRKISPELVTLNQPFSLQAESFRAIRSQMMMRVFVESEGPVRPWRSSARTAATARPTSQQTWPWPWRSWADARCWSTRTCAARVSMKSSI